jgi:hypothetical protein
MPKLKGIHMRIYKVFTRVVHLDYSSIFVYLFNLE